MCMSSWSQAPYFITPASLSLLEPPQLITHLTRHPTPYHSPASSHCHLVGTRFHGTAHAPIDPSDSPHSRSAFTSPLQSEHLFVCLASNSHSFHTRHVRRRI